MKESAAWQKNGSSYIAGAYAAGVVKDPSAARQKNKSCFTNWEEEDKCSSLVVGREASATGYAFFGRSHDGCPYKAHKLKVYPHGAYKAGQTLVNPFLAYKFPEEGKFSYTFTHDSYKFIGAPYMAYSGSLLPGDPEIFQGAGVNEKGVAASATNTTHLRPEAEVKGNAYVKVGLDESFAALVILAEAATASEAVDLLGRLVERDGVGDERGFVIFIGDRQGIWVFESAGRYRWVATKVPDDKFLVVANDMVTDYVDLKDREHFRGSADLLDFAVNNGFALYGPKGGPHEHQVNVAASYGKLNDQILNAHRRWRGLNLFASSLGIGLKKDQDDVYPMFVKPDHKISPLEEMNYHRDRYEGTPYDISTLRRADLDYSGYEKKESRESVQDEAWIRPLGHNTCQTVHVIELNDYPPEIGGRIWYCLAQAENSVFLPYYGNVTRTHPYCLTEVDPHYTLEEGKRVAHPQYQGDSAYFIFHDLGFRARANRKLYGNPVKKYWQDYEKKLWAEQAGVEAELLRLYRQDPKQAAAYADEYTLKTTDRALKQASRMRQALIEHLESDPEGAFVVPDQGS